MEGNEDYDFNAEVFITYDKSRKKRGVYTLNYVGWQTVDALAYQRKINIFIPYHINGTTATKQTIDNLDAYKEYINKAKVDANELLRIENIEIENVTLKSTITALEEKIKELTK